jgi:hypothetical protein
MKYQILLSYADEDSAVAERLRNLLQEKEVTVYMDKFAEVEKWGKNNIDFIVDVFGSGGQYCIPLLSKHYADNRFTNLQRQISQSKALNQKDDYILPIRLDNTKIEGFNEISCINYKDKTDAEIVSMVCKKLGLEKPLSTLASFFNSKQKKERLLFELRSDKDFGGFFTMDTYIVNNNLLKVVGLKDVTIIGCEVNPHRIQLSSSPETYELIRSLFISGKLNETTNTTWTSILPSNSASKLRIPLQSPLLVSSHYDERDFNPAEQTIVCHSSGIYGYTMEAKQAVEIIGNISTSNIKECKVYITKVTTQEIKDPRWKIVATKTHLYLHSNYKKPGCEYTTKIGTNQKVSLFTLLLNLTCLEYPNKIELQTLAENHVNFVQYFFDKKTLPKLDDNFLCGAENIQFV